MIRSSPDGLGTAIRTRRKALGKPLREVAESVGVDLSLLSKWERGERQPCEADLDSLASSLNIEIQILRMAWLTDTVLITVGDDSLALAALRSAAGYLEITPMSRSEHQRIVHQLRKLVRQHSVIKRAWLFGSFARGDAKHGSDIDLLVEYYPNVKVSYLDQFAIADSLQASLGRKVDIVERGMLKDFAEKTAIKDMKLISG